MGIRAAFACVVVLGVLEGGGEARAQQSRGPMSNPLALFAQLDASGDRAVDRGEVPAGGRKSFETLLAHGDSNEDGRLDAEEYRGLLARLRAIGPPKGDRGKLEENAIAAMLRARDKNRDGALDRDEFPGLAPLFDRIDADDDGLLSPSELKRSRQARERSRTEAAGATEDESSPRRPDRLTAVRLPGSASSPN